MDANFLLVYHHVYHSHVHNNHSRSNHRTYKRTNNISNDNDNAMSNYNRMIMLNSNRIRHNAYTSKDSINNTNNSNTINNRFIYAGIGILCIIFIVVSCLIYKYNKED